MASNSHFSLAFLFIFHILLAIAGQAVAGREIPSKSKNVYVKQPEWLMEPDHSFLIPGIGRVMVPPLDGVLPYAPYTGSIGGSRSRGGHIPGGDDTFIPNPGFEVPNPVGGAVPAPARP